MKGFTRTLIFTLILFTLSTMLVYSDNNSLDSIILQNKYFQRIQYDDTWKTTFTNKLLELLGDSKISRYSLKLMLHYLSDELPADPVEAARDFADTIKQADKALKRGVEPTEVGVKARYQFKAKMQHLNNVKNTMKSNAALEKVKELHKKSVKGRLHSKAPVQAGAGNKPEIPGMQ